MRLRLTAAALTVALGAIPAAAVAAARDARTHSVQIRNLAFTPRTLSIHPGDTVRWVFDDGATAHNVTGAHFRSTTQKRGTFAVRFSHAGTFSYRCTIHPFMTARIVVH
jgi:plastocyanin